MLDWQLAAALVLVTGAAAYVVWQFSRAMTVDGEHAEACGACPKSLPENAPKQKPLVDPSDLLKKP